MHFLIDQISWSFATFFQIFPISNLNSWARGIVKGIYWTTLLRGVDTKVVLCIDSIVRREREVALKN